MLYPWVWLSLSFIFSRTDRGANVRQNFSKCTPKLEVVLISMNAEGLRCQSFPLGVSGIA